MTPKERKMEEKEIEEKIRKLAIEAVCPLNMSPKTIFEINFVKLLVEFGKKVVEMYRHDGI
jgi:hypothetical protein